MEGWRDMLEKVSVQKSKSLADIGESFIEAGWGGGKVGSRAAAALTSPCALRLRVTPTSFFDIQLVPPDSKVPSVLLNARQHPQEVAHVLLNGFRRPTPSGHRLACRPSHHVRRGASGGDPLRS